METWEGTQLYKWFTLLVLCFHFAADERFARQYRHFSPLPDFPLTLPFLLYFTFSMVFPLVVLLTTLKITVSGRCACVCACVSAYCVCCTVLYVWKNTLNQTLQRVLYFTLWYWCVCVLCGVVRCLLYTKTRETLGKFTKHGLFFGTVWPSTLLYFTGPKLIFTFPNALYSLRYFPGTLLYDTLDRCPNSNVEKRSFSTDVLFQRS